MLTNDVPTAETLAFVNSHLPPNSCRILEVGSGDGALAGRLMELGHQILAVDSSADAVARARQQGVPAKQARWPDFNEGAYDVVLFTRSMHHMHDLTAAITQARKLLAPGGRVMVEDFAVDGLTALASEWLYQLLTVLDTAGLIRKEGAEFPNWLLQHSGALDSWRTAHGHHLHSGDAMLARLKEHFPRVDTAVAPYLYRYVCPLLRKDADRRGLALRILDLERRFAAVGGMSLIGRRFVGRPDTSTIIR
jgi:SAM-dependent methyltransferase